MELLWKLAQRVQQRAPDFVIEPDHPEGPYMERWYVLPRNRIFNIYFHKFLRSDEDFALHDHPWLFNASYIVRGWYFEHTIEEGGVHKAVLRTCGDFKFRWGRAPHRVELEDVNKSRVTCDTFFITGPVVRTWGFHCPKGWVPFKDKITIANGTSSPRKSCP